MVDCQIRYAEAASLGEIGLLIGIYAPIPPRGFDGCDPLLGQSFVASTSKLPCIARYSGLTGVFRFNVQPEMVDWNVVVVDCGEELAYLGGDGLASHACWLRSRAYCFLVEDRRGFGTNVQGNMYASMLVMPTAFAALYVAAMFESTAPPCTSRLVMFADV